MPVDTISWKKGACRIIDQTLLPGTFRYSRLQNERDVWEAIRHLRVRGAPAIGIAAAYGLFMGVRKSKARDYTQFKQDLQKAAGYLSSSRPTAVNLSWALDRLLQVAEKNSHLPIHSLKKRILQEAHQILEEDRKACKALGEHGAELIQNGWRILTHCNAGGLATSGYGTALALIYCAVEGGKKISVYADETRPLLQGARLTSWELAMNKIPVTVICDNMAGYLMSLGKIDAVIVGADRITASGDFANKIGTYSLAVLAEAHRIPFYVAAPVSSFDFSLKSGKDIPIEQRQPGEMMKIGCKRLVPKKGVEVFNPAFDVTPHRYATAFITEKGVIKPPFSRNIRKIM